MLSDKIIFSFHNVSERFNLGFNNLKIKKFNTILSHIHSLKIKNSEVCFDDGYEDIFINLNNVELGIEKTIFPITNYIDKFNTWDVNFLINRKKHINVQQLRKMHVNNWKIGSHGHNHICYSNLSYDKIYEDLKKSKDILENLLNKEINLFTPPFGYFDSSFLPIIKKAGYKDIYLNMCYIDDEIVDSELNISVRVPIYSIDNKYSINRKLNHSKFQTKFDELVHFFSKATVAVKKIY